MPKTKKPLSEAKLAANRANAKKSTGPKTPEGKARSAANSRRHALLAFNATLSFESQEMYIARQRALEQSLQPRNEAEQSTVDEYAQLTWNLARIRAVETRLLDDACAPGTFVEDSITKLANGFKNLHGEEALPLLHRYEMRTSRMKARALDEFAKLRELTERYPPAEECTIIDPSIYEAQGPFCAASDQAHTPDGPLCAASDQAPRPEGPNGGQTNPTVPVTPTTPTASAESNPVIEFARAAAILLFCFLFTLTQSTALATATVEKWNKIVAPENVSHIDSISPNPMIPITKAPPSHTAPTTSSATSGRVSEYRALSTTNSTPPQSSRLRRLSETRHR